MSYDLHALRVPPGTTVDEALDPTVERHDDEGLIELAAEDARAGPRWRFWRRR